jgi:hypothetical protein
VSLAKIQSHQNRHAKESGRHCAVRKNAVLNISGATRDRGRTQGGVSENHLTEGRGSPEKASGLAQAHYPDSVDPASTPPLCGGELVSRTEQKAGRDDRICQSTRGAGIKSKSKGVNEKSKKAHEARPRRNAPPPTKPDKSRSVRPRIVGKPLQDRIVLLVAAYEDIGTGMYLSDLIIASMLHTRLEKIQKHLLILEDNGLLDLSKAVGPSYGVRLTAAGLAKAARLKIAHKTKIH